jgi:hypothetical protein
MSFLHNFSCSFSRLKFLLILTVIFALPACSVGGGDSSSSEPENLLGVDWVAPSEREDVSPISLSEIAGYRVYYGTQTGVYPNQVDIDGSETTAKIPDLPQGTYYVVVTTVDTDGRESVNSSEVVVTI